MDWHETRKIFLTACRMVQALALVRRRERIVFVLLVVFPLCPNARAKKKTDDWRVVENLEPGVSLIVKAQRKYACVLEGATDDQLFCWVHKRRSFHLISIAIPRGEIHEIHKLPENQQDRDTWIGAGVGAAAGAALGASSGQDLRGTHAFLGAVGGAGLGAFTGMFVGTVVPVFQILVRHGELIYKQ